MNKNKWSWNFLESQNFIYKIYLIILLKIHKISQNIYINLQLFFNLVIIHQVNILNFV